MSVLGVFGGTFSPIHNGHLRVAIEVREQLALDEILVLPSGDPPHRETPRISAQRRLDWVRLACADIPGLTVDSREVERNGPSYTVDTLCELRAQRPHDSLVLLLGEDAANQFHRWHRWQDIIELAHLVFVERPYETSMLAGETRQLLSGRRVQDPARLRAQTAGLFMHCAIPPLAISSTRIRGLLKAGRSVQGLVPQTVIQSFIDEDIESLTYDEEPESC
tara:strand:+ start:3557 stop:4219 length:663 start_codon:yes stop_codon:yes gene_type:complete